MAETWQLVEPGTLATGQDWVYNPTRPIRNLCFPSQRARKLLVSSGSWYWKYLIPFLPAARTKSA